MHTDLKAQTKTNCISSVACWKLLNFCRKISHSSLISCFIFFVTCMREMINLVISLLLYKKL